MKKTLFFLLGVTLTLMMPIMAYAVTIDFEGLTHTSITGGGDTTPVPASVLTNNFVGDGVLFGKAGVSAGVAVAQDSFAPSSGLNSVVGLNAAGIIPGTLGAAIGDIYFSFVGVTDFVSFTIGDDGFDVDVFRIRSYDLSDSLIDIQVHSNTSRFAVSILTAGIHRVEIDFTGDYGYSMDDLTFNTPVSAVPEPSTLLLLGSGLVGFGFIRRKLKG